MRSQLGGALGDLGAVCGSDGQWPPEKNRREGTGGRGGARHAGKLAPMRIAVALREAWRLLNHGPTVLISTAHAGKRNVMAAAWVMPIDFEPCKLVAIVAASTFTRELLVASGECVVQAPTTEQVQLTWEVGSCSGREQDKFTQMQIASEPGTVVGAPLVAGCAAWLECKLLAEPSIQERYDMFVLECVAAWADDRLWTRDGWQFRADGPRTIHHDKSGRFFAIGERIAAVR